MTPVDRAVTRREITDALLKAMERRHEVLDVIVASADRESAVRAIADLLGVSPLGCEAVAIGRAVADEHRFVQMHMRLGGSRLVEWPAGEALPRIC